MIEGKVKIFTGGDAVLRWAIKHMNDASITSIESLKPCTSFGIAHGKRPVAACIFNNFQEGEFGNDMRINLVSIDPIWCQRHVLNYLAEYVFEDAGCERLSSVVREGNQRSLDITRRLGFRKEGTIRRGWNGKTNAILFGMLRSECKWLKRKLDNGQGQLKSATGA